MTKGTPRMPQVSGPVSEGAAGVSDSHDLWQIIDNHMLHYGRDFVREMVVAASGSYLTMESGRRVLDFSSGQMCATLGHNHPAIVEALGRAGEAVLHLDSTMLSPPVAMLVEALVALLPDGLSRVQILSTGGESNEAALRLAKLVTGRFEIVALSGSWHGTTAGASSATFAHGRSGYGPAVPGVLPIPAPNCYRCPIRHCRDRCDKTCLEVGFALVDEASVGSLAAAIVEPIQSAGGIIVPPDGYAARLRELCAERGMLLIYDEAQTGLGRTGRMFAFQHDGTVPDIMTLSKTLGAGIPLAATIASQEIASEGHKRHFSHYTSHASDPFPAEVGLAVVRTLVADKLAERAEEAGVRLSKGLRSLQSRFEAIGDIRGRGLLLGLEIVQDRESRAPDRPLIDRLSRRCFAKGLRINRVGGTLAVWRIAPPLTITDAEIDEALSVLEDAFEDEARGAPISN